jgi:SAM-dependent methyltransferase
MTDTNRLFANDWHVREATRTLYNGLRRHLKMLLRLPAKPEAPVVNGPMDSAVARYHQICTRLLAELGPNPVLTDKVMCEAGAGDGLAVAALLISLGARKVHLVELNPPVASLRQVEILAQLQKQGLPLRPDAVLESQLLRLKDAVVYHQCFMEQMDTVAAFDLIFSNSVLEHVEDVNTFFSRCFRSLKPGSRMVHCIDLGGHGSFEDPMPPLEFQIYPDWLFWLMCPPFNRATRRAVGEYVQFAKSVGFTNVVVKPTRLADPAYLEAVWPRMNRRIRRAGKAEVAVVEFILLADKP